MQPTMCSRCGKNVAVIFITKLESGTTKNEGLCLKCAREMGIKAGIIRPKTVWPFPSEAFCKAADQVKGFLTVEMSAGQMVEDVRLAVNGKKPVEFYGVMGGFLPTPNAILEKLIQLKEGK